MTEKADHALVVAPPPLVFGGYLLLAILLNLIIPLPPPWLGMLRDIAVLGVLGGLLLSGWSIRLMVRAHTSPDPHRPTTVLLTEGPYRRSRNPIYLGFLLIYLGFTIIVGTLWGVLLSPLVVWTVKRLIVEPEERYLQARFDARYLAYKSRVRQWL
jgi:protein-S-isoprenylcysteine O-methyltransferase Ste14